MREQTIQEMQNISVFRYIWVFQLHWLATDIDEASVIMARGGKEFDWTRVNDFTYQDYVKTVVKGPGELRQVVEAEVVKNGEPYLACLMGLSRDR